MPRNGLPKTPRPKLKFTNPPPPPKTGAVTRKSSNTEEKQEADGTLPFIAGLLLGGFFFD